MDGKTLTRIIDGILAERGISRLELCEAIGISSAAYTGWKKGSTPREDKISAIENYLGISLEDYEEKKDPAESLRDDLRILLRSAQSLPPSSVYKLIAQIEKEKEDAFR